MTPRPIRSVNFPVLGLLAKGSGRSNTLLYLKYTPVAGGHSHQEQLSFVLVKGGEMIAVDPGVNTYADPAHLRWYKSTAAHNTLLLDEAPQQNSTARCLAFGKTAGVDYLTMDTRTAYDSVRLIRTAALLSENLVLLVDQAQMQPPRKRLAIAYHQAGHWLDSLPGEPWASRRGGFPYLRHPRVAHQQRAVSLASRLPSGRLVRVSLDDSTPTDVITASDPAVTNGEVSSVFFQRPVAPAMAAAWCIALDGQRVDLEVEDVSPPQRAPRAAPVLRIKVHTAQGQRWEVMVNADQQPTSSGNSSPLQVQALTDSKTTN
nr:heparinase II/III-family protein [Hymenobacter ruricola]